ncbi:hypothetical protein CPB84DRAFT_848219 [Gymnopilus junonius]|uniref:Uncharacterized protein n=1 Tax=Gymnopilus junonius TaxID=109634 RepID=A0A9P5TPF1_GYMJU|nr:hypothetical protein CPB84DRAFT_848219 [Gymnopilus junonius]
MLSKVTKRVRRRSIQVSDVTTSTLSETRESVQVAPDLIRWGNFTDPFPLVALGGYRRYYSTKKPSSPTSPVYSPVLSHCPEPSPSCETPPTTPLFFTSPPKRCLTVIHEVSVESMTPQKPQDLVITMPTSLRRRRRTLLRTPSIERDFAVNLRHIFASSNISVNDVSSVEASLSHGSHHSSHSQSSSSSSDSHYDANLSDSSNRSEFPITPSTSVESGDEERCLLGCIWKGSRRGHWRKMRQGRRQRRSVPSRRALHRSALLRATSTTTTSGTSSTG